MQRVNVLKVLLFYLPLHIMVLFSFLNDNLFTQRALEIKAFL